MDAPKSKKPRKSRYRSLVNRKNSLIDVAAEFNEEIKCIAYLEAMRWPEGVRCLKCDSDRISRFVRKGRSRINSKGEAVNSPDKHLYQCLACKYQFAATTGTIFHDTHLPLHKWFQAVALMCDAKKGGSAMQLQRSLRIGSYRTAWYLNHRIRKAMEETPSGPLKGIVEADETYIGGKYDKRRKRGPYEKEPVFGVVERGGEVRTWHISQVNRYQLMTRLEDSVDVDASVFTDESPLYKRMPGGRQHAIVNHSDKEYARGEVHTGTIDGYWSLVKRGIIGSFHRISAKHLHRYLFEFQMRYNNRETADFFAVVVARLLIGSALRYKMLTADPAAASEPEPSDVPF
jgi:transposase-like protein